MPLGSGFFLAGNVFWAPSWERSAKAWTPSSVAGVSTALTKEITKGFYIGGEARVMTAYNRLFFTKEAGRALFIGPNLTWQINDKVTLNAAYTPQVWGKQKGVQSGLDTHNFERSNARLKLSVEF
jgi:hypothetical protein